MKVSSDRACVRYCMLAMRDESADIVSWLLSVGLAYTSVHRESSGLSFGTGLVDIVVLEAASSVLGAALSDNVDPTLLPPGSGTGLLPISQNKAASSFDFSTYPSK